jgi:glycosyltransferase involved in cell wall biosynthesis
MSASFSPQIDQATAAPGTSHRLQYVCFQATRFGQASYAHVHEILNGLLSHGWTNALFEPRYAASTRRIGMLERLAEFCWLQCRAASRLHNFDLLYCRYHPANIPILLYARLMRIPIVVEVNGSYKDALAAYPSLRPIRWLVDLISRASLRLADEMITVTPGLQRWLQSEIPNGVVSVIANATNADVFRPDAPCRMNLPQSYAVFVGSLAAWQGIETILEAVALPAWPRSVSVVIAGDGMLQPAVERAARVNPNLIYLGTLTYGEVPGLIARSVAALIPKNNILESSVTGLSPLKLYEAAACGVPVIVTDLPGMADFVIDNSCGLVIPCENPAALADAVRLLAADPKVRGAMSSRARQAVVSGNTWAHRAAETAAVLERCLRKVGS